ncbi:uncharacterized protein LOC131160556 isoform X2 [Malania oleifera]|uniref:uncharacterized protein LOC131160556 isoform X2 n=1 Tax=Malania oleifera TaxID=397392 RepID=UPI0025AEBC16|nr:uncharacterized protein LOC131160556 isoform X2 [Malania oleifera]
MEGSSSSSSPLSRSPSYSAPNRNFGGASKYLANLPSRGLFSSTVLSSNPGGMRIYICDHETSPPGDQQIQTDKMNILIRALTLKKKKGESGVKDAKAITTTDGAKKRAADKSLDGRASAKRAMTNAQSSSQDGASTRTSDRDFSSLTVERLRVLLKERGLSLRGKKNEMD